MALRDVFVARPTMDETEKWRATRMLARPTDRANDPYGDGYRVPSTRKCKGPVCVHYVRRTRDAPPDESWVNTTLRVMSRVWRAEVRRMGFRPPPRDGKHGGDGRFDVYLKELGAQGLYGYCAPEYRVGGMPHVASGYCVLDDDFARKQYGAAPMVSLRVTAAHEFFHAIQFGYDFREDPWLLESTAAWMEEQVADGADDNRRYLPYGQVARPETSLDRFDPGGFNQYGNWAFWEYLGERFGAGVVRAVWRQAGAYDGAPDRYSVAALRRILARHGGLPATFAAYAAALTMPARSFAEGAAWPSATTGTGRLGPKDRHAHTAMRINHLASRSIAIRPTRALRGDWRLQITVNAPATQDRTGGLPPGRGPQRGGARSPDRAERPWVRARTAAFRLRAGTPGDDHAGERLDSLPVSRRRTDVRLRGHTARPAPRLRGRRAGAPRLSFARGRRSGSR